MGIFFSRKKGECNGMFNQMESIKDVLDGALGFFAFHYLIIVSDQIPCNQLNYCQRELYNY